MDPKAFAPQSQRVTAGQRARRSPCWAWAPGNRAPQRQSQVREQVLRAGPHASGKAPLEASAHHRAGPTAAGGPSSEKLATRTLQPLDRMLLGSSAWEDPQLGDCEGVSWGGPAKGAGGSERPGKGFPGPRGWTVAVGDAFLPAPALVFPGNPPPRESALSLTLASVSPGWVCWGVVYLQC